MTPLLASTALNCCLVTHTLHLMLDYAAEVTALLSKACLGCLSGIFKDTEASLPCLGCCRCQLHIEDVNPHSMSANGWLEDTSKVQKYVMSDEDYAKRENTYKRHKEQMRQVSHSPYLCPQPAVYLCSCTVHESEQQLSKSSLQ